MHEERCSLTCSKWDPEWKLGISTDGGTKLLISPLVQYVLKMREKIEPLGPPGTKYLSFSSAPWRGYFPS